MYIVIVNWRANDMWIYFLILYLPIETFCGSILTSLPIGMDMVV
jgi:hypothetical protein